MGAHSKQLIDTKRNVIGVSEYFGMWEAFLFLLNIFFSDFSLERKVDDCFGTKFILQSTTDGFVSVDI